MGRCANNNGPAEAFSQLEIASYRTRSTTMLGLHHSSDVTFGSRGLGSPSLKLAKLKKCGILAEITKCNVRQIFPLYGMISVQVQ